MHIICVRKNPKWSQGHFRLNLLQSFINIFIFLNHLSPSNIKGETDIYLVASAEKYNAI